MDEDQVLVSKAELERLRAIQSAAIKMIGMAGLRHDPEWRDPWLESMNTLGDLLPVTRKFSHRPLR